MLSPELIKKIKRIHIKTGRKVNTMMAGQYKSVFRGMGIEFEEVREYSPGDEVKSIDWKVSARLGRPFVKLFREERELIVMLLVDMSASGIFGTTENLKRETAAEIAAILAFNAIRNNDKIGLILFTDRVEKYIPPKKGSAHVWRVIKEIFAFEPKNKGTNIIDAVQYLGRVCRKKSVSFLISDFLNSDNPEILYQQAHRLKVTSKKHELIGVLLSDPGEFQLPASGIIYVQDLETGEYLAFDASDQSTRRGFHEQKLMEYQQSRNLLNICEMDCIEINTGDDSADVLTRYFRSRELRKR